MTNLIIRLFEDWGEITLNRPEQRNAFDAGIIAELIEVLQDWALKPELRYLVLKGAGSHFSAGADLEWMRRMASAPQQENIQDAKQLASLFREFYNFPVPTLVRVQGAAMGGALGLVACADTVVASDQARFSLSELRLGLAPAVISPYLHRAIGPRALSHLALSARVFDAAEARHFGLIHRIVAPENLDEAILQECAHLRLTAPLASRACKRLLRSQAPAPDPELEQSTAHLIADLRISREGQEGLAAFFAHQRPSWQEES